MDQRSEEPSPQETQALLRRILDRLEEPGRHRWMEITNAVVLALATTASAWCAYESNLWGGVQTFRLADAAQAGRQANEQALAALQGRAFDAQMLLTYLEIKDRGEEKLATFFHDRFRPQARKALDAWLKTDPFNNPEAPKRPFEMAEYVLPETLEAKRLEAEVARINDEAQTANRASDRYVLLTVLFASVLFFGGIGGTFQSDTLKSSAFVITIVLFLVTVTALATMPICRA